MESINRQLIDEQYRAAKDNIRKDLDGICYRDCVNILKVLTTEYQWRYTQEKAGAANEANGTWLGFTGTILR